MTRRPKRDNPVRQAKPANDNRPHGGNAKGDSVHMYAAASRTYVGNTPADGSGPDTTRHGPTVYTDLPDRLPVIAGEAALVAGFLPDLLDIMLANDNDEPEGPDQ